MSCYGENYETELHCSCYHTASSDSWSAEPDEVAKHTFRCCSCGEVNPDKSEARPWLDVMHGLLGAVS